VTPERVVHDEHIWGTVVTIDIRLFRESASKVDSAVKQVVDWLKSVDRTFSTYRDDSTVSQFRNGEITRSEVGAQVEEVIHLCEQMRDLTGGLFNPWGVTGGFDPSGLVKGWATDRAVEILQESGLNDFMVNSGGDLAVRGLAKTDEPWVIGITHPDRPVQIFDSVEVVDGAVATSGLYERGAHIHVPDGHTMKARSATVVGPDCATADALATALLIAGRQGSEWFHDLPQWSGIVVEGNDTVAWGPAFS